MAMGDRDYTKWRTLYGTMVDDEMGTKGSAMSGLDVVQEKISLYEQKLHELAQKQAQQAQQAQTDEYNEIAKVAESMP